MGGSAFFIYIGGFRTWNSTKCEGGFLFSDVNMKGEMITGRKS
jgi:hypothetical protein